MAWKQIALALFGKKDSGLFDAASLNDANKLRVEAELNAAALAALEPQTDALTNAQLRASPVDVSNPALGVVGPGIAAPAQRVHLSNESIAAIEPPASFPLPQDQFEALAQATDGLTNDQLRASPVNVNTGLEQPTTPNDVQPVSFESLPLPLGAATEDKQLPDNHQVTVSNFPDPPSEYPLPASQALALTPQTDALTNAELRAAPVDVEIGPDTQQALADIEAATTALAAKTPNTAGAWGYVSGISGSVTLDSGKRVLCISAVCLGSAGTIVIDSGDAIPIPYDANDHTSSALSIEPKGNLIDPEITFTNTKSFIVEYVS